MRLALCPVTAVTCDASFRVLEDAAIHVENNRISYVGPMESQPPFEADETIGGEHLVALPGLVNAHTHAAMTLLRGYADDMALETWLQTRIWPFESHLQADDVYWGTMLAAVEMLQGGTTCCADMYHFYHDGVRAFIESGMRAVPGGVLLGFLPEAPRRIANAISFVLEYSNVGEGRITPALAPHSLYTCNADHWRAMVDGAHKIGCLLHTHASETRREIAEVYSQWCASPIQALKNVGALEGPLQAAHCVHLDENDLDILQESGTSVAHNPTSNLKLASGFAPVEKFLSRGIVTGLGTDGAASNNDLDMWEEMRLAALLHKATTGDVTAVSAQQALMMATQNGARGLNLGDQIGSLEAGKKADIILMDFDKPHLTPRHNVVSHLVYAAKASDVDTVLVDGRVLVRSGRCTQMDVAQIVAEVKSRASRLVQTAQQVR